ncbi:MAG: hypothetical protein IVW36_10835 [Dehalococcoidia bacterium]|nr:hypothetical protein [Dehalococcoidia bacterium]
MKRLVAMLAIAGLGLLGFAGACNLLNPSLTQVGASDTYGAQLQNNTGTNFLGHSFKVAFVDANGNVVDQKTNVQGCLRSWQNGASDFFSVQSSLGAATTANAIGSLDLGSPLISGTTVSTSAALSGLTATTPTLSSVNPTSATTTLTVKGTLKNNDAVTYVSPNVCVVVYGSSGQVVVTQKLTGIADLATGASTNFTVSVTVPNSTASVNSVAVWADGLENNVPTTPISLTTPVNTGAAKVAFQTQPSSTATGGTPFASQPVVVLQDSGGNTITTGSASTQNVTLTLGGGASGAALTCAQASNTVAAVAGVATFSGCKIDKASSTAYTLTASSPGATSATSNGITVSVGPGAMLGFTTQPPASTASGATFATAPVVAIQDAGGNTVTTGAAATATVDLSVFSGAAVITCTNNSVAAVAGIATFAGCSVDKAGSWTLRARTNSVTGVSDGQSASFAITPGAATHLDFTPNPPAGAAANAAFTVVVSVEDAAHNVVTSGTASTTSTTLTKASGTGTLSGCTAAVAAVNGVATFTGCKIDTAGAYTLNAAGGSLTSATSSSFNIT